MLPASANSRLCAITQCCSVLCLCLCAALSLCCAPRRPVTTASRNTGKPKGAAMGAARKTVYPQVLNNHKHMPVAGTHTQARTVPVMEVAGELARRLAQDVLPELELLSGGGQRRSAAPAEGGPAPFESLAVLLERVSAALKPLDVSEMDNHLSLRALLWELYFHDLPALLLAAANFDSPPAELSRLCEQVVEGASALPFLPPMMDPPGDCWPWLPQLVEVVARQPPLIPDPDAAFKSRQKVLMLYMSLLTFASAPEQRLGAAGFGLAQSLTALASQTLQQAVQLVLAKLANLDRVREDSPAVWRDHESAVLATVDKGMQAARFLEVFGQQWREAMREQGVEGLAGAQGVLEALAELLEYLNGEIDWCKTSNLHTKLHELAATALATTFDPWAECLPPHDTIERAQYQQRLAPLMLWLASSLSEAANRAIDTCQGRRPSPGQREKAAVGLLPRLALRLPLVVILVQQASEEIPEQGEEQHGPGAGAGSTQAPYPASVPPGSRSPSRLAPTVSLDDVVPLAESAVRYAGKARQVLRLAPAVPHLEERLAEGVGHLTGVLIALLDDALGTLQTTALPAEAAAELLPDLKGLLASCCKLAVLGSQAGRPLLLDEQYLPRLGWLVVRAAHLVVEVLLLKTGPAPQLPEGLDNKGIKERMRNFGFVPMASVPALLAVKRRTQDLGVLEQDAADMARYVTQLGRLGVLDEAARAGLGELLATELRLQLEPHSLPSNPSPCALLMMCVRFCLKEENTRQVIALVQQGLLPVLVEWCGQQTREAEHQKRVLAAASILLRALCSYLDKTSAQPALMPTFSQILPDIPDPDLFAQADPLASLAPYQAAWQPGPWQQVQAELLPQLQEVCKERATSMDATEPQLDGICRDLAISSFMCCAPTCTNLAGMSDLEVDLSKCTGCRAARYCSRGCQRQDWRQHKPTCAATHTRREQASLS